MRRHEITDEHWERIKDLLPGQVADPGVTAKDNRLFVNAVLWIAKTGAPWRDLPERFGPWGSAWKWFDRWAKKGVWKRVFETLQVPDLEWMIIWSAPQFLIHHEWEFSPKIFHVINIESLSCVRSLFASHSALNSFGVR